MEELHFDDSNNNHALLMINEDTTLRQIDVTLINTTISNIKADANPLLMWKAARLNVTNLVISDTSARWVLSSTASSRDSLINEVVFEDIKMDRVKCAACFRLEHSNDFSFSFINHNTNTHYINELTFVSYFVFILYGTAGQNITTNISNIDLSNITVLQDSFSEPPLFYLGMGGTYILSNINFQSRPSLDYAQLLHAESIDPLTLYL